LKKYFPLLASVVLFLSSCGTYTGQGAVVGGTLGSVLGSAIGGIAGGWRGSDVGTIAGMAGGAIVGAAIGAAADEKQADSYNQYRYERDLRQGTWVRNGGQADDHHSGYDQSGYDATHSGDDRIDFDAPGPRGTDGSYSAAKPRTYTPSAKTVEPGYKVNLNSEIEIRHARVVDADHDGVIRRGEECQVTFEIMNHSSKTIYDVQPKVFDISGNKHIHISPDLHIESIGPHSGVRYTASILADRKLKDGEAVIRVAVAQGNREITSQVKEFVLQTRKK